MEMMCLLLSLPDAYMHEAPCKITSKEHELKAYCTLHSEHANAWNEGKRKIQPAKVQCIVLMYQIWFLTTLCRRRKKRLPRSNTSGCALGSLPTSCCVYSQNLGPVQLVYCFMFMCCHLFHV